MSISIPASHYRARATSAEFGRTPTKGTDFVRVSFELLDADFAGETIAWDGYFTDNTSQRTIESLRHCGCTFPGNDATNLEGLGSQDVQIESEIQEYQDRNGFPKESARVRWVNALGGRSGVSPELQMSAGQKAAFKARMMGFLVASSQAQAAAPAKPAAKPAARPNPKPAARPAAHPPVDNGDDVIPF
jgi:hypothetical protein